MTIEEWAKDFKSYVNELQMPRDDYKGIMSYIDDALALLKEQEAVALKPHYIDKYGKNFICGVECGNCGVEISATYKFCPYCGRSVKWE